MKRPKLIECPRCHGEGVGHLGRCVRCRGRGLVRPAPPPPPPCPTAWIWYWRDATDADRARLCGDTGGPSIEGARAVCTLERGHAEKHLDHIAGVEWTGTYCTACQGTGRVREVLGVDHAGSTRYPREWACQECNGTGRKAA